MPFCHCSPLLFLLVGWCICWSVYNRSCPSELQLDTTMRPAIRLKVAAACCLLLNAPTFSRAEANPDAKPDAEPFGLIGRVLGIVLSGDKENKDKDKDKGNDGNGGGGNDGYGAPSGGYGAPSSGYGAPIDSYGAPTDSYGAP